MKTTKRILLAAAFMLAAYGATAQEKAKADTLECHIINFSAGTIFPGSGSASTGVTGGNMRDLYQGPYINFGIGCDYKYLSNWLVTFDGDMWIGYDSDNLKDRSERMGDIMTPSGFIMGWGGTDGNMQAYNRSLAARIGVGKMFTVIPDNPNSGIVLKLSGGWLMQKTVYIQDRTEAALPQLRGDYGRLYDHMRQGAVLTESVGFCYMSNLQTYVNFKVELSVSESFMWSTRPYVIDNLMGLNGKDDNRYFDLFYGLKLTWMFPLMGKTTYDYYYY